MQPTTRVRPPAISVLFAAICAAGLAVTAAGLATTPNPALVAVVCGGPSLSAGAVAWIAWVAAAEERRERDAAVRLVLAGDRGGHHLPHQRHD